jgi:hypothetical protein
VNGIGSFEMASAQLLITAVSTTAIPAVGTSRLERIGSSSEMVDVRSGLHERAQRIDLVVPVFDRAASVRRRCGRAVLPHPAPKTCP